MKHYHFIVRNGEVKVFKNSKAKVMNDLDYGIYGEGEQMRDIIDEDPLEKFISSQSVEKNVEENLIN